MIERTAKLAASAVLIGAAMFAGLSAWSRALPNDRAAADPIALTLHPGRAISAAAEKVCAAEPGCSREVAQRYGGQMMAAQPTSELPFLLQIASFVRAGDAASPDLPRYAELALERQPRARLAAAVMADEALKKGDLVNRLTLLERLLEVMKDTPDPLVDAVADIAFTPDGPALIDRWLQANQRWRDILVWRLAMRDFDAAQLVQWSEPNPTMQTNIIMQVLVTRGTQAAYAVWQATLPPGSAPPQKWPNAPDFHDGIGVAPFNWSLAEESVDREAGLGLSVYYSGRGRVVLAEQLMMPEPGIYAVRVAAIGDINPSGGRLMWQLSCAKDNRELGAVELKGQSKPDPIISAPIALPADCKGAWLRLVGVAGEFPTNARASIASVSLTQVATVTAPVE